MQFATTALVVALAASTGQAFTVQSSFSPSSSIHHSTQRHVSSTTRLFDTEEPSVWTPPANQEDLWGGSSAVAAPEMLTMPQEASSDEVMFVPSEEDLSALSSSKKKKDAKQQSYAEYEAAAAMAQEVSNPKRKVRASVKETGYDSMRNYIKSMCDHELLNKNEEIILAREIQILIKWEQEREELEAKLLR